MVSIEEKKTNLQKLMNKIVSKDVESIPNFYTLLLRKIEETKEIVKKQGYSGADQFVNDFMNEFNKHGGFDNTMDFVKKISEKYPNDEIYSEENSSQYESFYRVLLNIESTISQFQKRLDNFKRKS